jgi:hypothetical protein
MSPLSLGEAGFPPRPSGDESDTTVLVGAGESAIPFLRWAAGFSVQSEETCPRHTKVGFRSVVRTLIASKTPLRPSAL